MWAFFKPLRRKVGICTLMLACVAMAGWMRSQTKYDYISMNATPWKYDLSSGFGYVRIHRANHLEHFRFWDTYFNLPLNKHHQNARPNDLWIVFRPRWRFDLAGLHLSDGIAHGTEHRYLFVPYWSIVLPLTALSAFLLLSKPRQSTEKKIPEPVPNEGMTS